MVHTSRNHWYTSMAVCSSTSASSLLSLTGYCLAHQYIMIIHFFRGSRDFAKKLDSLIDLVVLHLLQYQHIPSVMSRRFLSRIARAHLIYNKYYVTYDNFDLPRAGFSLCQQVTSTKIGYKFVCTSKNRGPQLY